MHHSPNTPIVYSFPSAAELVPALTAFIAKAQKESVEKKGKFTVALSGGSLPKQLKGLIGNPAIKWDKWYDVISFDLAFDVDQYPSGRSFMQMSAPYPSIIQTPIIFFARPNCINMYPYPKGTSTRWTYNYSMTSKSLQIHMNKSSFASSHQGKLLGFPSSTSSFLASDQTGTPVPSSPNTNCSRKRIDGLPISRTHLSLPRNASPLRSPS